VSKERANSKSSDGVEVAMLSKHENWDYGRGRTHF
jgi:hypothetical protein